MLGYQLISDVTVSTATTQVDFTGLNIDKTSEYRLVADYVNGHSSGSAIYLYTNDNITGSNYYRQHLNASSSTIFVARYIDPEIVFAELSSKSIGMIDIKLTNSNYFTYQSSTSRQYGGSSIQLLKQYGTSTFTLSSITKLAIKSSATNGIGVGSRFQLIKFK